MLKSLRFDTILGEMIAVADEQHLYLLEFMDYVFLARAKLQLEHEVKQTIDEGSSSILALVQKEIDEYLKGNLRDFKTPIMLVGTEFQKLVWQALKQIPYGATINYSELAKSISKPKAFRAAANSNGSNKMVIINPCHRVIASSGNLGGYSSGVERKRWLLALEKG